MKLLHLYYDLMNLYGEYGNIVVLAKHLSDQGLEVSVDKKTIGDNIDFSDYDFIYCGSGTERNQMVALNDLLKYKNNLSLAALNSIIFFTGNAMELLGESIDDHKALNMVPMVSKTCDKRFTGDVIVKNNKIGEVVGFINKCTYIKEDNSIKLFDLIFKDNNLDDFKYEGYSYGNIYGTHIIGPVLVKNPCFMNYIVKLLLDKKHKTFKDIYYPYENESYLVTLKALKDRIK